jgi:ribosomal protein S18 acetylase RimI-like enzyme
VASAVIVEVPGERLDELEPLWHALHDHHDEVSPHLRDRKRSYERSWESRRQSERALLRSEPGSFVLAAAEDDRYVGYAFVRLRPGAGFASTWAISDPYAELYTLSVLPECRGQLIGSALMDTVESRLRELGIADMVIGVVATNVAAIEFYERRGAAPFDTRLIQRIERS